MFRRRGMVLWFRTRILREVWSCGFFCMMDKARWSAKKGYGFQDLWRIQSFLTISMKHVKNNCQEVEQNKEKLERIWQQILETIEFGNHESALAHSFVHSVRFVFLFCNILIPWEKSRVGCWLDMIRVRLLCRRAI